jgi:carbamoylphosphate synthase large subunit
MKKRILISAGGTATAWHLATLVSGKFASYFDLFVCDINPPCLIPASRLAQRFFQVPLAASSDYHPHMLALFAEHKIDIFVPLVDADGCRFSSDSAELAALGVRSTGASSGTSAVISNKRSLSVFLESRGFRTPRTVSAEEVANQPGGRFFIKPEHGLGSKGARVAESEEVLRAIARGPGLLVQELCREPEVTVEVFNQGTVLSLCRERLETKAGVCTKARIFTDPALHSLAERLCGALDLPLAFCFQVMTGADGEFLITDVNPRLGAGTALSTAYGWSLASAALVCWGDLPLDPRQFLRTSPGNKYVVRVYEEKVMD